MTMIQGKKKASNKCWWGCRGIGNLNKIGNVKWCVTLKTTLKVIQNINIELPYDPVISLLGLYSKEMKIFMQKVVHKYSYIHYS